MQAKALGMISSILLFSLLSHSVHASPVAMASNLTGKPEVRQSGGSWKSLNVLQRLSPGDVVRCGPNAEAVIMMFTNGVRYKLSHNQQGTVQSSVVKGASIMGGMGGANIRVAKAMTGLDTQPFMARGAGAPQLINPTYPGYQSIDNRSFTWLPIDGAVSHTFTLFDQHNHVVWSIHQEGNTAEYPADMPAFATNTPYVWTLTGFTRSGKAIMNIRWGIITFLSNDDITTLKNDLDDLKAQQKANPKDPSPLELQVELNRRYKVYESVYNCLMDLSVFPINVYPAMSEAIAQVSPYAVMMYNDGKQ